MRKTSLTVAAIVVGLQSYASALVGVGVSYGRNMTTVDKESKTVDAANLPNFFKSYGGGAGSLKIDRTELSGLQQVGTKIWLDLPLIPVEFEGGANVAWGAYKSTLAYTNPTNPALNFNVPTNVSAPISVPGVGKDETPYTSVALDLSIRYPFLKLPPLSPITPLKLYVGGGVSWFYATRTVSEKDAQKIFDKAATAGLTAAQATTQQGKQLEDNLSTNAVGGHVLVGAQFKIPVIPIALYVDGKWYINAATSDAATKYPLAVSAGVAFAL